MSFDPAVYAKEVSPGAGCGPDLYDTEPAFAALMDSCEEMLPERFSDFDRSEVDFTDLFKQMDGFLKQSRDLRLLVLIAQFSLLSGQIHPFANVVRTIRQLIDTYWQDVHPQDADFGHMERMGALEALSNRPTVFLPLESASLFKTKRTGPISYRAIQIASGAITPREDEHTISLGSLDAALTSGEIEQDVIDEVLQDLTDLPLELEAIAAISSAKLKESDAKATPPNYEKLISLVRDISRELTSRLGLLAPEAEAVADAEEAAAPAAAGSTSATDVQNAAQAKLLLDAIEEYFATREPSHPALFLVREAGGLVGKSYLDALRVLMPRRFDDVTWLLGTSGLQLSNDRLIDLNEGEEADWGEIGDFGVMVIDNRAEAMRQIGAVKSYYLTNEPTSPIPLLLEEAQSMGSGSFTGLLNLFLRPEEE